MPKVTIVGNNETGICNLGLPDCPHSRTGTNTSGSLLFLLIISLFTDKVILDLVIAHMAEFIQVPMVVVVYL